MTIIPYNSVNDDRLGQLLIWLKDNGVSSNCLIPASNDAGFRRYFRVKFNGNSLIAVDAPPERENTKQFIEIAKRLELGEIHTPKVHCYSLENGFMLIEDFGSSHLQALVNRSDTTRQNTIEGDSRTLYNRVLDTLITIQQNICASDLPHYDHDFLTLELGIFTEWYLQHHLNFHPTPDQKRTIDDAFDILVQSALEQPKVFVHRDYHSRNIMLTPENHIGVIDFQDAVCGPATYDPASLLRDAYLDWPIDFQISLMERHRYSLNPIPDRAVYRRWFDLMGLQRHLKILGIFSRLHHRDEKSHYLKDLPLVRRHIFRVLDSYPELENFSTLFRALPSAPEIS